MATTPKKPLKPARKPPRRRKARKPPAHAHIPTDQTRGVVRALVANGARELDVCKYLTHMMGVPMGSPNTLRKHYAGELATARQHALLTVAQSLYKKAVGAPAEYDQKGQKVRDEIKPEVTAQIFYLKAQGGWRDHVAVEHSGPEGRPIPVSISSLTTQQLEQLKTRLTSK